MLGLELRRVFNKRINKILLGVCLLVAVVISGFAINSEAYIDDDGVDKTGINAVRTLEKNRNEWKGVLTNDVLSKIVTIEKQIREQYSNNIPNEVYRDNTEKYYDVVNFIIMIMTPERDYNPDILLQLTDVQQNNIYDIYDQNISREVEEYGKTPEQKDFLKKQYSKIGHNLSYEAKDSWSIMAMYAEIYAIILALVIGFLCAGIFAEEYQMNAEAVFFSTKYGRTKAIKNKICAALVIATIVYWISVGIMSSISFSIMGISGFNTMYQIQEPYSIYYMTFGQYYLLILVCGYIASLLSAAVTMLITTKMHTANIAVCVPFVLFCVSPFLGRIVPLKTLFKLTPDQLVNVMSCVRSPILFQIGGAVFQQVTLVMLIYVFVLVIIIPFIYRNCLKYGQ